jgi:hypothetical protein
MSKRSRHGLLKALGKAFEDDDDEDEYDLVRERTPIRQHAQTRTRSRPNLYIFRYSLF